MPRQASLAVDWGEGGGALRAWSLPNPQFHQRCSNEWGTDCIHLYQLYPTPAPLKQQKLWVCERSTAAPDAHRMSGATGGATTTGPDATYPPAICQNSGGGGGGGSCRGSGGGGVWPGVRGGVQPGVNSQNSPRTYSKRPNKGKRWVHSMCGLTSPCQQALCGPLTP